MLARVNAVEEEGRPAARNESAQRGQVEATLTSLHQRLSDLEKGERALLFTGIGLSIKADYIFICKIDAFFPTYGCIICKGYSDIRI